MRSIHHIVRASVATVALAATAHAQTTVMWVGPAGGGWGTAANWNPQVVPQNQGTITFTATVNANGPVVDGVFTIAGLSVNDQVLLGSSSNLGFGTGMSSGSVFLNGNGSLNIAPGSMTAPTAFTVQGGHTLTISGNGSILMGGLGTARILGSPGSTIDNQGWRIVGEGNLCEGFVALHNAGTITASDGRLTLAAAGYTNSRLMSAAASGVLRINGNFGSMSNSGTILADGGIVELAQALQIDGGTLTTANGGTIMTVTGGTGTMRLIAVTNRGNLLVSGGTNLDLESTIDNRGSITVNLGGNLRAFGSATLGGSGTVLLQPGSGIRAAGAGTSTFVNLANTIRGSGEIADIRIVNEADGRIEANGGTLTIRPSAAGMRNTGVIVAGEPNGATGTLVLSGINGGSFDNDGGRVVVGDQSVVLFMNGLRMNGGTLATVGSGNYFIPPMHTASFQDVSVEAQLDVDGIARFTGHITGSGTVHLKPNARKRVRGTYRRTGGMTRVDRGAIVERDPDQSDGPEGLGPELINDGLFQGAGSIGLNGLKITNNGTFSANDGTAGDPGIMWIDPSPEGLLNAGIMESDNFGVLMLNGNGGGSFTQQGTALIRALAATSNVRLGGTTFSLSGGMLGSGAGSITVDGGTTATLSDLTSDALLTTGLGTGTILINNNVINNGTVSLPSGGRLLVAGASTLNSASGHIQSNGSITIQSNGNLDANFIAGTGSVLVQSGGTLRAHAIRQGRLTIDGGGFAHLKSAFVGSADPSRVGSLSIGAAPAFLDVANRVLIIDQSSTIALNTLRNQIIAGHNGGAWDGPGIRSSSAAANPGHGVGYGEASAIFTSFPATYFGETIDNTTLLVTYTRYGDANLDRIVNLADFNRLAANFGQSNKLWTDGDFTYDGIVNLQDFNRLAANFGLSAAGPEVTPEDWSALASLVPEPGAAALLILPIVPGVMSRRRRRANLLSSTAS